MTTIAMNAPAPMMIGWSKGMAESVSLPNSIDVVIGSVLLARQFRRHLMRGFGSVWSFSLGSCTS